MDTRVQVFLVLSAVCGAAQGRHVPLFRQPHPGPESASEGTPKIAASISVQSTLIEEVESVPIADNIVSLEQMVNGKAALQAELYDPENQLVKWGHTGICPEERGICKKSAQYDVRSRFSLDQRFKCVQLSVVFSGAQFNACVLADTSKNKILKYW